MCKGFRTNELAYIYISLEILSLYDKPTLIIERIECIDNFVICGVISYF